MSSAREILEVVAEATAPRFSVIDLPSRENGVRRRARRDVFDRFMAKVRKGDDPDDCWIWTGGSKRFFLDRTNGRKGTERAIEFRKFAYEMVHGPVDRNLWAQCRNERCCNPRHLAPKHPGWAPGERTVMTKTDAPVRSIRPLPDQPNDREALARVLDSLSPLANQDRTRVLLAACVFFGIEGDRNV